MEFKDIKRIAELMKVNDLSEFEMEDDKFRVAMRRGPQGQPYMIHAPAAGLAPVAAPAPAGGAPMALSAPGQGTEEDLSGLEKIVSPIVGTFYSAASPEAPAYVKVGDPVGPDTTVCIIEAMKVMNEIKAEVKGVIKKILVESGTPVEFGEALFLVEPN